MGSKYRWFKIDNERILYDLAGAEDRHRFSPYCWRAKLALAHKGLAVHTVPWRFTEKDSIAFSEQSKVPVLVDGKNVISGSWEIAVYLEDHYSDRASLFGEEMGRAIARFANSWADRVVIGGMAPIMVPEVYEHLHEKDRDYFRASREQVFGVKLEEMARDTDSRIVHFRQALDPLRTTLCAQPFLCGEEAAYADYSIFGAFQWAHCVSDIELLAQDDPIVTWIKRIETAFNSLAGAAYRPQYA